MVAEKVAMMVEWKDAQMAEMMVEMMAPNKAIAKVGRKVAMWD